MTNLSHLPPDLPIPVDDGACRHLVGMTVPSLDLVATDGSRIDLSRRCAARTVVYCYPLTGVPGQALPDGWDAIPGARGCTPQSCAFRDHHAELVARGGEIFGLSTQDSAYQGEAARRLHLPFPLLSDHALDFVHALGLPTFHIDGMDLVRRLTLIIRGGRIEHVFYPVFPPDGHAAQVVGWLERTP